jgi:hypothetical protein
MKVTIGIGSSALNLISAYLIHFFSFVFSLCEGLKNRNASTLLYRYLAVKNCRCPTAVLQAHKYCFILDISDDTYNLLYSIYLE